MQAMSIRAAVVGASGYAGGELVRLLDDHPRLDVAHLGAHSQSGSPLGSVHPHLAGGDRMLGDLVPSDLSSLEAAFLALPHGASWEIGARLADAGVTVFDLGSDYRMDTADRYAAAYGTAHPRPNALSEWAYGLPELVGVEALASTTRVAIPGCYPTASLLGLAPLYAGGVVDGTAVVDAVSGVTGAGRAAKPDLTFGAIDQGVRAYAVGTHRHRPEIEMGLTMATGHAIPVQFTPHLVPMQRGLLATASAQLTETGSVVETLEKAYAATPFVDVIDQPPSTRWTVGSNRALIHAIEDAATGRAVVTVAIDNLGKGAAGQAVQCANLAFGFPETEGLTLTGWLP